jgi:hypothetical protein
MVPGARRISPPEGLISAARRSMIVTGMLLSPSFAWKLVLAIALGAAIVASAYAKAPRRSVPSVDLHRLVGAALLLYAVGLLASLSHRPVLAAVLYAAGIAVSALAAWLSRGSDSGGGPGRGDDPADEQPPPDPDGVPQFDWAAFEREFRVYSERRERTPAS